MSGIPPKNYVVYECHFCSHRNVKRGTRRGYLNDLYLAKPKTSRVDPTISAIRKSEQLDTCIDKAKVGPTKSAKQKSEHLDTLVTSINKARVGTTESATQKSDQQFDVSGGNTDEINETDVIVSSEIVLDDPMASPATPITSLLDSKKRKRNRTGSKKKVEPLDVSSITNAEKTFATSNKRKKNSWTSLKEIAESQSGNSRKFPNISVPFVL